MPPAGPYWRVWHPSANTTAANLPRTFGPLHRFDPHPAGPPAQHDGVYALYGSLAFEVSTLEVFARGAAAVGTVVEVCPRWRGSLISAPRASRLFDLTDQDAAAQVGASPRLGDTDLDTVGYETTQAWGRFFHASAGVHGVRYLSCRAADRSGIATVLQRRTAIGGVREQHRLVDDALWPYLVHTLDSVGTGVTRIDRCPRCVR
ncbi:MAG: RES domain-containing protein [Nitriliruptor sp.]|uniref:RES domain-containing protein n=1 Tax=Nitriliruptor sp. TaxID=2448056 RepID=UPI0034A0A366